MQTNLFIIFGSPKFCLPQVTVKLDLCKHKMTKKHQFNWFLVGKCIYFLLNEPNVLENMTKSVYTTTPIL